MTKKELFIQSICKPIAELTEQNDHSGAIVALCEYVDGIVHKESLLSGYCAKLLEWAKYIQTEHNKIGHLPMPLCAFRTQVMNDCLMLLKELRRMVCRKERQTDTARKSTRRH